MTRLDEILKRCEAATPGPWELDYGNWEVESKHPEHRRHAICGVDWSCRGFNEEEGKIHPYQDAEFIANARTDLPLVVAALKKAVEALEIVKSISYESKRAIKDHVLRHSLTEIEEGTNQTLAEIEKMLGS